MRPQGIDELRNTVSLFNGCNETFNTSFSAAQLIALYRAYDQCGYDITPDVWADWQIDDALLGHIPQWHSNLEPKRRTP
jgi:hypothetical protein